MTSYSLYTDVVKLTSIWNFMNLSQKLVILCDCVIVKEC